MLTAKRRGLPAVLGALAVSLLLTGRAAAGDILEEAKARQAVEAQRVEQLVRDAEKEAQRVGRSRPATAADRLRTALAVLDDDTALAPKRREQLKRSLTTLLRDFELEARNRNAGLAPDPGVRLGQADLRRGEDERRQIEADRINRTMGEIRALQRDGRTAEANRLADDLARRFPNNPAIAAGRTTTGRADAVADNRYLNQERNKGFLGVNREVERSAANVVADDIEFPRDWAERIKKRTNAIRMTEKERQILKALNTPYPAEFSGLPFQDVIKYLEKISGVPIAVDQQALRDANVSYTDSNVTFNVRKASLRAILHRILGDLGLTYIVKDETIQVTSIARAKETLSARTYYVGDLVGLTDLRFGPLLSQLQAAAMVNQIAVMITQTVEPESWAVNGKGGLGTIAFEPVTMSLVVRQTAEVHFMLGVGMR